MNYPFKKILLNLHIGCGIILFLNFLGSLVQPFTLLYSLSQIIKYIFLITGVILFFFTSFKDLKGYFSIYALSPLIVAVSLLFGLAGLIIVWLMLIFIIPKGMALESNNYNLYLKTGSPMKKADAYELTQDKYFIFEKKLAEFKTEEDIENGKINVVNDSAHIRFTKEDVDYDTDITTKFDTIIKIAVE